MNLKINQVKEMKKNNCFKFMMVVFCFIGCTTEPLNSNSFFTIKRESNNASEVVITPDRVLVECEELDEDPDVGAYGFMVFMLDEENTITTSSLNIMPDKKNCEKFLKKVNRILKNSKVIYIGGHGSLTDQKKEISKNHPKTFPGHGTFYSNSRAISFDVIENDRGDCYSPSYKKNEPCPQYPFPIEKYEK